MSKTLDWFASVSIWFFGSPCLHCSNLFSCDWALIEIDWLLLHGYAMKRVLKPRGRNIWKLFWMLGVPMESPCWWFAHFENQSCKGNVLFVQEISRFCSNHSAPYSQLLFIFFPNNVFKFPNLIVGENQSGAIRHIGVFTSSFGTNLNRCSSD